MAFWIPMAMMAASAVYGAASKSSQNKSQQAWANYNTNMQFNTDVMNLQNSAMIAAMNARNVAAMANFKAKMIQTDMERNIELMKGAEAYNSSLIDADIDVLWENMELDTETIKRYRGVERGVIEAGQSISSITMNQDSAAEVITDQMAQEALELVSLERGATQQANLLLNDQARGRYDLAVGIQNVMFEGRMAQIGEIGSSQLQAAGILAESHMRTQAGGWSAASGFNSGMQNNQFNFDSNQNDITNGFVQGMFSAASSGVSGYYQQKVPTAGSTASSTSFGPYKSGYKPAIQQSGASTGNSLLSKWGV